MTLTQLHLPLHTHTAGCSSQAGTTDAAPGNVWAVEGFRQRYLYATTTNTKLASDAVAPVGGQGHENMQPFLCLNFIIALEGVIPPHD